MPRALRERARKVAKREHTTTVQLIRDGLRDRIDYYEQKFALELERQQRDREAKRSAKGRTVAPITPMSAEKENPLAPRPIDAEPEEEQSSEQFDPLAAVYVEQGRRLLAVVDKPLLERRLAIAEAVLAVKRRAPLSHPSEEEIRRALEDTVLALQHEKRTPVEVTEAIDEVTPLVEKTARAIGMVADALAGRSVDPRKTQALGDLSAEAEQQKEEDELKG